MNYLYLLSDMDLDALFHQEPTKEPTEREVTLYGIFPDVEKQLKFSGQTLHLIWQKYFQNHPDGYQSTVFYKHYNRYKHRSHPSMHMIHKASDKMFVDFAGKKLHVVDSSTREIKNVEVFVAILGASRLTYVEAVASQNMEDFIMACENALHFFGGKNKVRYISYYSVIAFLAVMYSFRVKSIMLTNSVSDPLSVDSAFTPFKPNLITSWDSNYFYVESYGIPITHGMMTGIIKWQQQVPIPQCYIKPNAWMIPLNPVVAAVPVPVDSIHFTRGAIAVAVNGIPIFNYHTNTGVDSYLDGQLDQWGGHCGRADDYHYHIAPMQLYSHTSNTMPIAYALDGFAVYGNFEPDGSTMLPLDANNGHYANNGIYHYHGVATAPYMIGNMVGQVTEDTTHQIIPQPHANPVRPALTPLNGAVITNCTPNSSNNGYTLTYNLNGNIDSVVYSWTNGGLYTFNFYTQSGMTTSNYNGFIPCQLPTSIIEIKNDGDKIQLFPNPSSNSFSLNLNNPIASSDIKKITILSNKGETVFTSKTYQDKYNIENLSKGIYFVIIQTANKTFTKKLVLQ